MRLKEILTGLLVRAAQILGVAAALLLRGKTRRDFGVSAQSNVQSSRCRAGVRSGRPGRISYGPDSTRRQARFPAAAPLRPGAGRGLSALAGTDMCSGYKKSPGDTVAVIDGNDPFVQANLPSSSFGIDMNCEFRNFPISAIWPNGLTPTLNFYTPNKTEIYLIVFDNVWYSGNMACSNIDHKLWVVNSEEGAFSGACQNIMIPAETIDKRVPAATATIGLPFTYTLTIPSMNFPVWRLRRRTTWATSRSGMISAATGVDSHRCRA